MHVADVVATDVEAELPDGLEEREDLDVAHRAADLGDDDVDVVAAQDADAPLDLVGDVRDDLHGLAEVVAPTLGGDHRRVDRTGGGVGVPGQRLVDEPLVVPEVEVGLAAVVGDEHLAVLERVHRARVDVEVGVELLHRDPQAPGLQQSTQGGCREPLPQGAGHSTCHEDVLRHPLRLPRTRNYERECNLARATRPPRCTRPGVMCHHRCAMSAGAPTRPRPAAAPSASRHRLDPRVDLLVLAGATLVLRLPAFFAARHLTFDDGVYGASAVAHARGRAALPRRVLEPGPGVPPPGVAGRPARACTR